MTFAPEVEKTNSKQHNKRLIKPLKLSLKKRLESTQKLIAKARTFLEVATV